MRKNYQNPYFRTKVVQLLIKWSINVHACVNIRSFYIYTRYDVDGIHFDDYFYHYPVSGLDFPDDATYAAYVNDGGSMSRDDWRRDNVNRMVRDCRLLVSELNAQLGKEVSAWGGVGIQ